MHAWSMVEQLADEELIDARHLASVEALVRSARRARVSNPEEAVAAALLSRLECGMLIDDAIARVEELVAVQHNRMLIDAGRRAYLVAEADAVVLTLPQAVVEPVHAA
jgi:hypothetical protein